MLKLISVPAPVRDVVDEAGIYIVEFPKGDHNHELDFAGTRAPSPIQTLPTLPVPPRPPSAGAPRVRARVLLRCCDMVPTLYC
jgi:hypothetical protein